jgi:hypothetical protein
LPAGMKARDRANTGPLRRCHFKMRSEWGRRSRRK